MIVTLYTFKSPFILQILTKIKREEGKKRKEGVGKLGLTSVVKGVHLTQL